MTMPIEQDTPPTREQQLCEYVVNRANAGADVATILAGALEVFGEEPPGAVPIRRCRSCGCTDEQACPGGCWWVDDDLCSTCHRGQPSLDDAMAMRLALIQLKRRNGWAQLGLA